MNRAYCLIRSEPHYRRDAFMSGLKAAGYDARTGGPNGVNPGDVVVMWNRYNENHEFACRIERQGGIVLVAENGYLGPGGVSPHQMEPREIYALAVAGHNGSGTWPSGGPERWDALGVDLKPWRTEGEHILVCPNRSFGRPDTIMPYDWPRKVVERLQRVTKRPVRVRPHPGNGKQAKPLEDDLRNAWAVVIWSSSAGVQALIRGIPVVCEAPYWICQRAASDLNDVCPNTLYPIPDVAQQPISVRRQDAMHRLAWAQWHTSEIASGAAFRHLLSDTRQAQSAAAV